MASIQYISICIVLSQQRQLSWSALQNIKPKMVAICHIAIPSGRSAFPVTPYLIWLQLYWQNTLNNPYVARSHTRNTSDKTGQWQHWNKTIDEQIINITYHRVGFSWLLLKLILMRITSTWPHQLLMASTYFALFSWLHCTSIFILFFKAFFYVTCSNYLDRPDIYHVIIRSFVHQ